MAFWLNLGGGNLEARFMDVGCRAAGAEPGIFVWGAKCDANIFIKTNSTHIYIQKKKKKKSRFQLAQLVKSLMVV